MSLPTNKQARKEMPVASGVLSYFPDAIAEVAHVSFVGNQQHNPGQPMHWARHKSTDHGDCIARHLIERGTIDNDGLRHSAKLAWRALALLQIELEAVRELSDPNPPFNGGQPATLDEVGGPAPAPNAGSAAAGLARQQSEMDAAWAVDSLNPEWPGYRAREKPGPTHADLPPEERAASEARVKAILDALFTETPPPTNDHIDLHANSAYHKALKEAGGNSFRSHQDDVRAELFGLGCPSDVAKVIADGTSFTKRSPAVAYNKGVSSWVYVAGPMRGKADFNFPAFDATRDRLLEKGYNVISPADIDRVAGDKPHGFSSGAFASVETGFPVVAPTDSIDTKPFVLRDFWSLFYLAHKGGAIALLPGWYRSTGATAECFLARWLKLDVLDAYGDKYHSSVSQIFALYND